MDKNSQVGTVIRYRKGKGPLYLYAFIFLLSGLGFDISVPDMINVLVYGKLNFVIQSVYPMFLMALFSCGILIIIYLVLYNKMILSNSFITIKRFELGKTYTIAKKCIIGKCMISKSTRGGDVYQIHIYLKNGKKISTGSMMHCDKYEANRIYEKIDCQPILEEEVKSFDFSAINAGDLVVNTNYIFLLTAYLPIILTVIGGLLLTTGFNYKYGVQKDFQVSGIVMNKETGESKGTVYYKIIVMEDNTSEKYRIGVNKKTYDQYAPDNKVSVVGKKGILGILYNIVFEKVGN